MSSLSPDLIARFKAALLELESRLAGERLEDENVAAYLELHSLITSLFRE